MIYCLNPQCAGPKNPKRHRFCQSCGWRLQLGDRYEAVYSVGEGRNSHTFVGRDRATLVGAQCLIKQFTPKGATVLAKAAAAERWRREVEQLAIASRHPQIPDLFAYFERGEQQFLVQQFLVGPHLEQQLQEKMGPFDSDEVRAFLRNVLPILHHLHQNRLIHRDIKPSNFRQPPGQSDWWLVDFGAIKPVTATAMAQPGTLIGSADYAAPEQLRGEATYASDLYSLGVVCLHLLTGLQPFDLFDGVNGCWQWRSIVPDVAPSLATLIDHMVQPVLRDRLPDVLTAMASLGMTVPAPPDPVAPRQATPLGWTATTTAELRCSSQDVAIISAAQQLAWLTTDGSLEVRSLAQSTAPGLPFQPRPQNITAIAAHPQQPIWVSGDRQGQLWCWELQGDRWQASPLATLDEAIAHLVFSPAGDGLLVADALGRIHVWHWPRQTWQGMWRDHAAKVNSLAFSHDGKTLASGDSQGSLKLWDWSTQTHLRTLSQQPGAITTIAWLPGDEVLVTAGWDVTLRWRCPQTGGTFNIAKAAGFYLPVRSLLSHTTEPWVVAGSQDGQLQLWASNGRGKDAEMETAEIRQAVTLNGAIVALSATTQPTAGDRGFCCLTATGHLTQWAWPV
ncbi:serine/threonine-protein kinase [Halomicronema sp. CCY15110]|uniref:serine/threonine-protein kinase n=1 Tax=Halomicronema sp. CCY15110 TaxID=2767773 RepID=UPI0019525627|nr:serine/threonine-protein kinase [Halomicronema sp. CCY15110]